MISDSNGIRGRIFVLDGDGNEISKSWRVKVLILIFKFDCHSSYNSRLRIFILFITICLHFIINWERLLFNWAGKLWRHFELASS